MDFYMSRKLSGHRVRIAAFIDKIVKLEKDDSLTGSQRSKKVSSLWRTEIRHWGGGETKEQIENINKTTKEKSDKEGKKFRPQHLPRIAPSTYSSYLSDYRSEIKALNYIHFDARDKIAKLQKKFPNEDLTLLDSPMPALRDHMISLKALYLVKNSILHDSLSKLKIEHSAFYAAKVKLSVRDKIKHDSAVALKAKHSAKNLKFVNKARIESLLVHLAGSSHWVDLSILVALASGRRAIEVLKVGAFNKVDDHHVLFSGQAKTKSRGVIKPYKIPVLIHSDTFIEAFNKLRMSTHFEYMSNDEINAGTAARLNMHFRRYMGVEKGLVFKDSRAIYLALMLESYHDNSMGTVEAFGAMLLGHSELDVSTQVIYKGIVLEDEPDKMFKEPFTQDSRSSENVLSWDELSTFDEAVADKYRGALTRLHSKIKSEVAQNSRLVINQSVLCKLKKSGGAFGVGRSVAQDYLKIIGLN